MAYPRPDYRLGGFPIGAELGEEGPSGIGGLDRGFRRAGGYAQEPGYGGPSYEYERERPLGGAYVGGASDYYGAERPGGYGYEREGYGREAYGREGYAPSVYDQGYSRRPQMMVEPPVDYVGTLPSDLGMGLRDADAVARHRPSLYGAGFGRPDVAGYGGAPGYGAAAYEDDEVRRLKEELANEKREKHELELAAAGAAAYGLHERREKIEEEEEEDISPKRERRRFHFFSRD